jgi:thiol-disulfide isomerase/thioredoxin
MVAVRSRVSASGLQAAALAMVSALLAGPATQAATLAVGSKAPAVDIEHWVQDGEGRFAPVTTFVPGQVYVLEFWATWCGPCLRSMPHLAELQRRHAADGVTVISVSDEDVDTVNQFLDRQSDGTTFREITKDYCLTADPDGSTSRDYMEAAEQNGIPTAFIIGRTGEIEWIGHPMQIDQPLAKIADGSWNREAYAASQQESQALAAGLREVTALLRAGRGQEAVALVDGWVQTAESADLREQLVGLRRQVALRAGGPPAVVAFGELAAEAGDSVDGLNDLAWSVVVLAESGQQPEPELVAAATAAAHNAVRLAPRHASALDTLAHLQALEGRLDDAIATQREAVANAEGELVEPLRNYLEALQKQAESGE